MEYNFDIDLRIGGKVIVPDIPCKALLATDAMGEWYIKTVQVEAMDGTFVDPDDRATLYIMTELKTREHEEKIHRLVDLGEAA